MEREIWTSGGHHQESGNIRKMAQREKAKAGKSRRHRVIFILLGLLFLKFCVLLVFISFLIVSYSNLYQQVFSGRSCDKEWLEYEKHCYFLSTFQLTWTNAENMCLNRGGYLAIINNKEEQNFLDKYRKEEFIWFGLTDQETENTFKWVDGTKLSDTSFSYWGYGEPNNEFGIEHCVEMWYKGKWNDEKCNETRFVVCEKPLY